MQPVAYRLVYDATRVWFPAWPIAAAGLVALGAGVALLALARRGVVRHRAASAAGTALAIFGAMWALVMGAGLYGEHARLATALRAGDVTLVEGTVHDRPVVGGAEPAWVVESGEQAHWYRYSGSPLAAGYHRAGPGDGGLGDGAVVRVSDVDGKIARIEVRVP